MNKRNRGFFSAVERIGNKIPDPMVFFLALIVMVLLSSCFLSLTGFSDINPATGETVAVYNLLSKAGVVKMLTTVVSNFSSFSARGMTLTCMLGMAVAEKTGLFESVMRQVILSSKGSDAKIIIVFCIVSILADITNGAGFVIMPLLGAVIWSNMGRNPIVGMICGYGSVAGAFSANFMIGSTDIICAGFTQTSAQIIDSSYTASAFMGWYFQSAAAIVLTITTYLVTVKIVEPRFGKPDNVLKLEQHEITPQEKAALRIGGDGDPRRGSAGFAGALPAGRPLSQ